MGALTPDRILFRGPGGPCYWAGMSIALQVHDSDPAALADLIANTMHDGVVIDREPTVAHLSALLAAEDREGERRRAAWKWLNSVSATRIDRENDWSDV
jgi:hypothetical protein